MEFKDIIGKTIKSAVQLKDAGHPDDGFLRLEFTDGTGCTIIGCCGGYDSDAANGEYPSRIYIERDVEGLIPAPEDCEDASPNPRPMTIGDLVYLNDPTIRGTEVNPTVFPDE